MWTRWQSRTVHWLFFSFLCCLVSIRVDAAETVLMRVYLNQQDKGDWFFKLESTSPLFKPESLRSMGLERLPDVTIRQIDGAGYLDLVLMQGVSWRIDEQQSAIYIDVPFHYFGKQSLSRSLFNAPEDLVFKNEWSGYANYGIDISDREGSGGLNLAVPFETVFHAGNFTAFSNFLYTNADDSSKFVRFISSVTRDDRESMTRLTLGDFAATTGFDGGGGLYGGISISRNFSIDPYFNRFIALSVYGQANTQSQVEYYLDNNLMFTEQVSPGQFEFQGVRPPSGAHQSRMVIRDVFGRENVVYGDFYFASRILKPGVHEFSYNAGFERENFGQRSADYGKPAALGFHRAGLTDWLTLGGRAEFGQQVSNIGGSASILVPHFGEVDASLSGSSSQSSYGHAASVNYRYNTPLFSFRARFRTLSEDYSNLSLEPGDDKTQNEWLAGLSLNSHRFGNGSAYFSARKLHSGFRTNRTTFYYSKRIGRLATLVARYTRLTGSFKDDEFFLSLGGPLGKDHSAFIDYRTRKNLSQLSARVSKNRPLGEGFGYVAEVGFQDGNTNINGFGEYSGPVGLYSAGYRRINGHSEFRARAAGSVSWVGNGIQFSRPIADGFALVKVENLSGVEVRFNNQFMGKTNQRGELVIPRLQSYLGNQISIDDKDIPINYEFSRFKQVVTTPFRAGAVVEFDGTRLQAFTGRVHIESGGEYQPAEYWKLNYQADGQTIETLVGKSGEFYIENLEPGGQPIEITSSDSSCHFDLNIPETENMYVDLGEIICELSD